ncbi:MAG: SCO family protein [Flavobacteriia bacterium]|jgi:protein SCO1/2
MKRVIILLIIAVLGITISYYIQKPSDNHNLKVYNPVDVKEEMVDSLMRGIGIGHRIGNFSFENQEGKIISLADVKGNVFVAEYFFTTCGTICPRMNKQMQRVQKAYIENDRLKILSFTVDPEIDTVAQMKRYADGHKAISGKWHFLTGEKSKLYELARKSFFVLKPAEAKNLGDAGSDFIHTNNFVLVDKQLRIRGYYDGTSTKEVNHLIEDIQILLDEK